MPGPSGDVLLAEGPWRHRFVTANGSRFHLVEAEPTGSGPLVLLLHGFPTFWWTWRRLLPALADAGHRAVAIDLRGYGASDKPPRGYDPFTLTGDVAGLVRALGEPDAVLVGQGWGGFLAWSAAVLTPDVVRAIAPVSMPHPRRLRVALTRSPRQALALRAALSYQLPLLPERRLLADDAAEVGRILAEWSATPGWPDADVSATYRRAFQTPAVAHCSLEYYRWAVRSLPRPDGLEFAEAMAEPVLQPVLEVLGTRDQAMLPGAHLGSGDYVKGDHRWARLPCGHFPQEEVPGTFARTLLDWLADTLG